MQTYSLTCNYILIYMINVKTVISDTVRSLLTRILLWQVCTYHFVSHDMSSYVKKNVVKSG